MIHFTALGGMIPLINMQLGEIIVGGVGAGLYGMLIFVVISIFVAGLMVGRTPEYVGKKIEAREVKMAMLAILVLPLMYLGWTAVAVVLPSAVASMANAGPHGFTEVLYAYISATGNNGSAFAGLYRQHLLLQPDARQCDVRRPLLHDRAGDGAGGFAGRQEVDPAVGRHAADHRRPVRRPRRRRDPDHRRSHLLPGARARPDRRASRDERQHPVLIEVIFGVTSMEAMKLQKRMPVSAMLDPKIVMPADRFGLRQARPAADDQEPRDVRGRGRGRADHGDLPARPRDRRSEPRLHLPDHPVAVVHGAVRQFRRSRRRRPRQGAGRIAAKTRTESQAKLLTGSDKTYRLVPGTSLKVGDIVLVEAGDNIPSDGEVIEGVASVNEAAITGESAPVIRESGGDRSAVTGGTQVLSDWIRVRITAAQGSTFIDRMIKLVEGAERQKTPNEIALNILLAGLTIIFVFATVTIPSYADLCRRFRFRS